MLKYELFNFDLLTTINNWNSVGMIEDDKGQS